MSESGVEESGKPGKRKAKAEAENSGGGNGEEEYQLAAADPLLVFGSEIMTIILGKLDLRSVAEARLVSRGWQAVASSDRIWAPKEKKANFRCTAEIEACYGLRSGKQERHDMWRCIYGGFKREDHRHEIHTEAKVSLVLDTRLRQSLSEALVGS